MSLQSEEEAREYCAKLGDADGLARLDRFAALLIAENARQNLIARTSEQSLWRRHFADSAQLLAHVSRETSPWLDLGTGAGFPGLIIAALRPEWDVVLVESRKKRAEFLADSAKALNLPRCRVAASRLELVEAFPAGAISARAFAPLDKLLGLSARFSTHDTVWLLPKGRSARQEVSGLSSDNRAMFHVEHSVTDEDAGILIGKGRPG